MNLFSELKRRNVIRIGVAYLVIGWLLAQVSGTFESALNLPQWFDTMVVSLLLIGFPIALVIAWAFELTPEGVKREQDVERNDSITNITAKKLDYITIVAALAVAGMFLWQQFNSEPRNQPLQTSTSAENPSSEFEEPLASSKSIAALPFTNRSSNEDDKYFVDGVHDDLLTKLAKIHQMKVISRTSVMEYRDTTKKIPQIAKELGVANILEGGVQRSGSHIRINAQLIRAANDEHLWAETYDKELNADNVFAIQSEIAIAIANAMETALTPGEKILIDKPLTDNLIAWEAYQKGLLTNSSTIPAFKEQVKLYETAIELDPNFAAAYAHLAIAEMAIYWFGENTVEQRQHAWQAIETSRAIDNNTVGLFTAEASYYYWGFRDFDKALQSVSKALAIAPNNVGALDVKGYILRRMGRFEESIKSLDLAASLNPRSTYALQENAETSLNMLRIEDAEKYIQKIENIQPNNLDVSIVKGYFALAKNGNLEAALHEFARNKDNHQGNAYAYWRTLLASGEVDQAIDFGKTSKTLLSTGYAYSSNDLMTGLSYFISGDQAKAAPYLQQSIDVLEHRMIEDPENKNYLAALCRAYAALGLAEKAYSNCDKVLQIKNDAYDYPFDIYQVVIAYAMLNEKDKAIELLHRMLESKIRVSENELKLDPFTKNLQNEPEFINLIKRIGSGELVISGSKS